MPWSRWQIYYIKYWHSKEEKDERGTGSQDIIMEGIRRGIFDTADEENQERLLSGVKQIENDIYGSFQLHCGKRIKPLWLAFL